VIFVPRAGLEPARLCSHRILSPDNFPENTVESAVSYLHFDAKYDISAPNFRPFSILIPNAVASKNRGATVIFPQTKKQISNP